MAKISEQQKNTKALMSALTWPPVWGILHDHYGWSNVEIILTMLAVTALVHTEEKRDYLWLLILGTTAPLLIWAWVAIHALWSPR